MVLMLNRFFLFFLSLVLVLGSVSAVSVDPVTVFSPSNFANVTITTYSYDFDLVEVGSSYVYMENVSCTDGLGVILASSINHSTAGTNYLLSENYPCRSCTATGGTLLNLYPLMVVIAGLLFIAGFTTIAGPPTSLNTWILLVVGLIMIVGVLLQIVQSFQGVVCT